MAVLRAVWMMEAQLKSLQRGATLVTEPETVTVIFWQRMWLPFVLVLRTYLRPNLTYSRLISLVEDISRETNINYVKWLLVIILIQVFSESEQKGRRENKMYSLERKGHWQV